MTTIPLLRRLSVFKSLVNNTPPTFLKIHLQHLITSNQSNCEIMLKFYLLRAFESPYIQLQHAQAWWLYYNTIHGRLHASEESDQCLPILVLCTSHGLHRGPDRWQGPCTVAHICSLHQPCCSHCSLHKKKFQNKKNSVATDQVPVRVQD